MNLGVGHGNLLKPENNNWKRRPYGLEFGGLVRSQGLKPEPKLLPSNMNDSTNL